ncbi:MAG: DNA-deoxyinosine glycosylase [Gammaproteobacteria bacterium]|uniref:DNA-deoxyinosine glycosylase n=1 Tax=Rhodoferax sp. TaxID=50421 RepID=UPI0018014E76|nr:DNA-deoxyinosine glycosylase [Rhodoferax sp.]MBU3900369.1 DNA-deoxyinosine glycosylase [Gammaproteobacteria bacterium]MBA3058444.1 DNA-deoxyinosine glycosylase [Rhodoferax sp.]MBU3997993.1 DNA-deoxyinosine glycosylase [Gammaproteobacteria bacterium]MBU4018955.1 DNA-deoxyinosine glycosylase [Gammaproteobacteria bacterium]MBU4080946.1 DNA-deoxyinosine glycosylase [Gammaproteobacteria bacterium]
MSTDKGCASIQTQSSRLFGLPSLVSEKARVLVLGRFPSITSLARQQYYAHPQNQFWRILQAIFGSSPREISAISYEERSDWLLEQGLGVWDVYASCARKGRSVPLVIIVPS